MILSVLFGALLYITIQLLWYSPWGFGRAWLASEQSSPTEALRELKKPRLLPESIQGILLPSLLMSIALHALYAVLGKLGVVVFFGAIVVLFLLTVAKKYREWKRVDHATRLKWQMEDGVLLLSILTLALFVFFLGYRLY